MDTIAVQAGDDEVGWSNIITSRSVQPLRLGPFRFRREDYEEALEALA